jgi:hypothetical protein
MAPLDQMRHIRKDLALAWLVLLVFGHTCIALPPPQCFSPSELAALGVTPLSRPSVAPIVIERDPWTGHYLTVGLRLACFGVCFLRVHRVAAL